MNRINNAVLQQFSQKGLTINEGVAVDARLVQSGSQPINGEEIKKQREKRETRRESWARTGIPSKFLASWIRTGRSRTTSLIMD
jgi:IS5 family transposase